MLNRTIRELFNRAGGWTEVCDVTQDEVLDFNEHLDPELFAELLIKECIIATGNCCGAGELIKEHFGV